MISYASPLAGGGEALVEPPASSQLPLNALFNSSSGSLSESFSSEFDNDPTSTLHDPSSGPVPGAPSKAPASPESSAGPSSTTFSATGGHSARRFLSDPQPGSGHESSGGGDIGTSAGATRQRGQRKSTRVLSLARWYERLASGQTRSGSPRATRSEPKLRRRTPSPGSTSLPRDFSARQPADGSVPATDEVTGLRQALQAEKAARTEAEAQLLSLQNALRNSKRKVDAQKQRMDELTGQLNESLAALAPVQEILAIAEVGCRHFVLVQIVLYV